MNAAALTTTTDGDADGAACTQLMRGGSKSFFAASLVLPARVRAPATALYAYCRIADDTVDLHAAQHGGPAGAMAYLHRRLAAMQAVAPLDGDAHDARRHAGEPPFEPAERAFAAVMRRHALPLALPLALLDGFAWDMAGRRYRTLEQLHDYAARVAGSVGAMMALVMGVRDATALARAGELGVAMQLTNIARDVGEDARLGRIYLPLDWLHDAGIDADAWLAAPRHSPAMAGVVARLLAEADRLYAGAEAGVAALPRDCRAAIMAARLVYAEIGREVERAGCDSVSRRAVVAPHRKLGLMARALSTALRLPASSFEAAPPALPAVQFLVDSAVCNRPADGALQAPAPSTPLAAPALHGSPARPIGQRLDWTLTLFERLRQQQRAAEPPTRGAEPPGSAYGG